MKKNASRHLKYIYINILKGLFVVVIIKHRLSLCSLRWTIRREREKRRERKKSLEKWDIIISFLFYFFKYNLFAGIVCIFPLHLKKKKNYNKINILEFMCSSFLVFVFLLDFWRHKWNYYGLFRNHNCWNIFSMLR